MTTLHGTFYDGKSAQRVPVTVRREGDSLFVSGENVSLHYSTHQLNIDPRVGDVRRAIHLPHGAQIQSDDHALLDEMFPRSNQFEKWINKLEKKWGYALGSIIIVGGVLWYSLAHGLPFVAEKIAVRIPAYVEQTIGEQTLAALDKTHFSTSTLKQTRRNELEQRFKKFTDGLNKEHNFRLEFRASQIGPNAFALPGGAIVMTDALVALAKNDEELLAVLAHEIGHVKARHGLRLALQTAGATALIATLAGDAVSITSLASALPAMLTQANYSREFENEADTYAFSFLKAQGISSKYFADIMTRLGNEKVNEADSHKDAGYLSSHPATEMRIKRALENQ